MQPPCAAEQAPQSVNAAQRKAIHDLRNLFAIIGAAKSLLERDPPPSRRAEILAALDEAARQGGKLTTSLLANSVYESCKFTIDVMERLKQLAPMLRVLSRTEINLAHSCQTSRLRVRADLADFDAAIVELVANAVAAGANAVTIRSRLCGSRVWLLVSDNGCGMSATTLCRVRRGYDLGLAHGTGLARIRQFITQNGGDVLIRSRPGGGTSFALIFPAFVGDQPLISRQSVAPPTGNATISTHAEVPTSDESSRHRWYHTAAAR
jgi:signal transduction histidine kinase